MVRALFSRCSLFLMMIFIFYFAISCKSMKKDNIYGIFVVCSPKCNLRYSINNSLECTKNLWLFSSNPHVFFSQVNAIHNLSK